MNIYIAGPMRGIPYFNYPAFHAAAAKLRAEGHHVFSPAERDIEHHGFDISKDNPTGSEELATLKHGFSLREALRDDLEFICLHATVIALLPGWEQSKGAKAELATARALGLEVMVLPKLEVPIPRAEPWPKVSPEVSKAGEVRIGSPPASMEGGDFEDVESEDSK